ncbi:M35 family metallo-endopeptidase [Massilia cellulosiltytica]|uniref:M35 family metallo-endopeptidase n=1 Tax=Massilia cellulosiltytica TaxID=2683234 RepID=UPI00353045B9
MHEITHFTVVAGTGDWVYGQAAAGSDPARAVDNADSHEYFRENEPRRSLRTRR